MTIKVKEFRAASAGKAATPRQGLLRLERLANILEDAHRYYKKKKAILVPDNYDETDDEGFPLPVEGYDQNSIGHACGTPACAIGHYAFNTPTRWGWDVRGNVFPAENFQGGEWPRQAAHEFALTYDGPSGAYEDGEVAELFEWNGCGRAQTALEAARYIRKFVAKKRKELGLKKPVKK